MSQKQLSIVSVWLQALCCGALALGANTVSVDPNRAYFIGPQYSFSKRDGYYDFADIHQSQLRPRSDLSMFGAAVGKRFMLNGSVRLQASVTFEGGSVTDDTLRLSKATSVKYAFYHAGFEPELHFPLYFTGRTRPFVLIGGGVHYVYVREHTYFLEGGQEVVWIDLPPYVRSGVFSASLCAGAGFDYALSRSAMVSLWYSLRYWQPVRFGVEEDFPLFKQRYHETFFSNRFLVALLFDLR
jgi:hypothetical protein